MTITNSQREHKHLLIADEGETVDQMWARAGQFTNNVAYDCRADYALIKKTGGRKCGPGFDCDKVIERAAPHRIYDLVVSAGSHSAAPTFAIEHVTGTPANFYEPQPYDGTAPVPIPPSAPVQPYPDEHEWWGAVYEPAVAALYARAGLPFPDNSAAFRWFSRCAYDIRDGMTKEAAMAKHLAALAQQLGL